MPTFKRVVQHSIAILALGAAATYACAAPAPKTAKADLPPSADLRYAITAKQSGFSIQGNALVKWFADKKSYSIKAETHAMIVGKVLEAKSEGIVSASGLSPITFSENHFRKAASVTNFDRADKQINFTQSDNHYPIKGGEQDRSSIVWQIAAMARANPQLFKTKTKWEFFVVGPRDAEPWHFTIVNREKLQTALGEIEAVHIFRAPPPDAEGQKLDIWLAPQQNWYPVRLRFTEPNGDFIEQKIESITPT